MTPDTLPSALTTLTKMHTLIINGANQRGDIHEYVPKLTNLQRLSVANNKFDTLFPDLRGLSSLTRLDMQGNKFVGPVLLPSAFIAAGEMCTINTPTSMSNCVDNIPEFCGNFEDPMCPESLTLPQVTDGVPPLTSRASVTAASGVSTGATVSGETNAMDASQTTVQMSALAGQTETPAEASSLFLYVGIAAAVIVVLIIVLAAATYFKRQQQQKRPESERNRVTLQYMSSATINGGTAASPSGFDQLSPPTLSMYGAAPRNNGSTISSSQSAYSEMELRPQVSVGSYAPSSAIERPPSFRDLEPTEMYQALPG